MKPGSLWVWAHGWILWWLIQRWLSDHICSVSWAIQSASLPCGSLNTQQQLGSIAAFCQRGNWQGLPLLPTRQFSLNLWKSTIRSLHFHQNWLKKTLSDLGVIRGGQAQTHWKCNLVSLFYLGNHPEILLGFFFLVIMFLCPGSSC